MARSGAIIIGAFQLTVGVLVSVHFLLNHLEVIGWRANLRRARDNDSMTINAVTANDNDILLADPAFHKPLTDNTTVHDHDIPSGAVGVAEAGAQSDSDDKLIGYILFSLLMLLTIGSGILAIVIAFVEKNLPRILPIGIFVTSLSVGFYLGAFFASFILGYHWMDILPLLIWGIVQIFFVISLKKLTNNSEFLRVPVPA